MGMGSYKMHVNKAFATGIFYYYLLQKNTLTYPIQQSVLNIKPHVMLASSLGYQYNTLHNSKNHNLHTFGALFSSQGPFY